jgi:hypothetical protein
MQLEAVQAQAGHASIESTRIYLHLTDDWLADEYRRAAAQIDADHAAELLTVQRSTSDRRRDRRAVDPSPRIASGVA